MKYILLLLLSISAVAQTNNNISVVSAEKLNVVYRGIDNPIKIAVPGIPSEKTKVSAPGIRKGEGEGNYILTPGAGNEVKVMVTYPGKDSIIIEEKIFRIKNLPALLGTFNKEGCYKCQFTLTKEELIAGEIGIKIPDFLLIEPMIATSFTLLIYTDKKKLFELEINDSKINNETIEIITRLKPDTKILIYNIRSKIHDYFSTNVIIKDPSPIQIILTD